MLRASAAAVTRVARQGVRYGSGHGHAEVPKEGLEGAVRSVLPHNYQVRRRVFSAVSPD